MGAAEAQSIRATLGLTQHEVAARLGVRPAIIDAFESGTMSIPRRDARILRYMSAMHERRLALEASGLPACDWVEAWEERPLGDSLAKAAAQVEELNAHTRACPTCQAREEYLLARFGPAPRPPVHGGMGLLFFVMERIERLPEWARPPAQFALGFLAFALLRGLLQLPRMPKDLRSLGYFLLALAASLLVGAMVGLVVSGWRMLRARLRGAAPSPRSRGTFRP